jgi:hypothetical protein
VARARCSGTGLVSTSVRQRNALTTCGIISSSRTASSTVVQR